MELRDAANQQRRSCIMLGKRPHYYYENRGSVLSGSMKRERVTAHVMATVPRCQVDGCDKALIEGKEYHRRHKVCEPHSKAPVVLVLGSQQRFCQQCSRFHSVSEFDDAKRSCRSRLAGHNERRRKSTQDSINVRSSSLESTIMGGGIHQISSASSARALSLLSSNTPPWLTTTNLSSLSRAALLELIAENRAAILAGQLLTDRSNWRDTGTGCSTIHSKFPQEPQVPSQEPSLLTTSWNDELQEDRTQVTLDLMQMPPGPSFDFVSGRNKNKEEEECCEFWKSLEGTHVV